MSSCLSWRHDAQMSKPPEPPGRVVAKNRWCPSRDSVGDRSLAPVLMTAPRLTGMPQGSFRSDRRATHRSSPPKPPGRVEVKYRLSPFFDICGANSSAELLIKPPRLAAGDQSEF